MRNTVKNIILHFLIFYICNKNFDMFGVIVSKSQKRWSFIPVL